MAFQCFAGDGIAVVRWSLPEPPKCGQPLTSGVKPLASDCLFILRAAVKSATCDPTCQCDTNGDQKITAPDALLCLKKAVGQNIQLNCPC